MIVPFRVLLFPPVNNYLRLLFHKTVESYPPLHSFSVGEGAGRQTVVCWKQAVIRYCESYPPLHSFSVGEDAGRRTVVCWKQAVIRYCESYPPLHS